MKYFVAIIVAALFVVNEQQPSMADTPLRGNLEEAKSMALRAVSHIKTVGKDQAFIDFHDKSGVFFDKDLYVFVKDFDCTFLAHGLNPKLVGRNIWNLKNPSGSLCLS